MDYLDPHKKRRKRARIMIGYGLLGVVIAVATVVLLYVTSGYYVDRETGTVIQNGLIYVDSKPESAKIYINGEEQGSRTDARLVVPNGSYTIRLEREGYRGWERIINLEGGSLRRVNYARLVPNDLDTATATTLPDQPSVVSQSIDKRWLVMAYDDDDLELRLIDLQSSQFALQDLKLPVDLVKSSSLKGAWEILEWADDNKTFLASYTTDDGVEYLLINRDKPLESVNVADVVGDLDYDTVSLRNRKKDQLFAYESKTKVLSATKTDGKPPLRVVADTVEDYTSFGDDVLYVENDKTDKKMANVILKRGSEEFVLRKIPREKDYLLDLSKIGSAFVAGVSSGVEGKTYVFNNPLGLISGEGASAMPKPAAVLLAKDPTELRISTDSSVITVRSGYTFATHEFEEEKTFTFDIEGELDAKAEFRWMDGRHFTIGIAGVQHLVDYNGDNQYVLVESVPGFGSYFSKDIDDMFTFSPADKKKDTPARMLRTFMRTPADR